MKAQTISVFIAAPATRVYEFAANPANLPRWVPSFCKSVELVGKEWVVQSPEGRVVFTFVQPNDFGVLDHIVTLPSGMKLTNYMRVIPNGEGSEVLFTLFQQDGMTEQQFQDDAGMVLSDLQTLRRVLETAAG